jgi:hypothetical protein
MIVPSSTQFNLGVSTIRSEYGRDEETALIDRTKKHWSDSGSAACVAQFGIGDDHDFAHHGNQDEQ